MDKVPQLNWSDEYSLGDPVIDQQHQRLFELTNIVLRTDDPVEIGHCILALFQYTRLHFSDEEALMEQRGYKWLERHRNVHTGLMNSFTQLIADSKKAPLMETQAKLRSFMFKWVLQHILDEDMKIPLQ